MYMVVIINEGYNPNNQKLYVYMHKLKVFFTAAYAGKKKYQQNYDQIVQAIQACDVELVATELGNYQDLLTKKELARCKTDRERHYLAIKRGIQWADLVILELSEESFQVGHEATIALYLNKPVLGLSLHEDWGERIMHRYFHGAKYTKYFVVEIIANFIRKFSDADLSERFNLFLSKQQLDKLEAQAKAEGMNKSEYLRYLLEK